MVYDFCIWVQFHSFTNGYSIFPALFMANRYMEKETLLIIKEIQIKTTMSYHFGLVKVANMVAGGGEEIASVGNDLEKNTNIEVGILCWYTGILLVEMRFSVALVENIMEVPPNITNINTI